MSVAFHCQAKEGLHARRMAWNASFYTNALRRVIMSHKGIHHVASNHSISAESPPSAFVGQLSKEELVSVVVQVPFYWQPQWTITRTDAPLLRKIEASLSIRDTQLTPPRIHGGYLYQPTLVDIDNQTPELVQDLEVE